MKNLLITLALAFIFGACTNNKDKNSELKNKYEAVVRENDSLKALLAAKPIEPEIEVTLPVEDNKPVVKPSGKGRHPITLQWISWDKPGYVEVTPIADGWYTIVGKQTNEENYLKIDGKIRRLSEKELEFTGVIETLISSINNGEPCVREGKQLFLAKGSRKYFRLQNMTNCEGGMLVDYIDIYPGTSSL